MQGGVPFMGEEIAAKSTGDWRATVIRCTETRKYVIAYHQVGAINDIYDSKSQSCRSPTSHFSSISCISPL